MDYAPRYPQPFTLSQALGLDVSVITEEITRLQNSLEHLKRTQSDLLEAISQSPDDPEYIIAHQENEGVIGSQSERISMLRVALAEKGIPQGTHYDQPHFDSLAAAPRPATPAIASGNQAGETDPAGDGGIDL